MINVRFLKAIACTSTLCCIANTPFAIAAPASKSNDETIQKSVRLIEHGEQKNAIVILSGVIKNDPTNVEALLARARAYQELNKVTEGVLDAEKAIAIQPDNTWGICRLGILVGLQRDYPRSITLLTRAIAVQPQNALFYVARADVLVEAKLFQAALSDANKAVALSPRDSLAYFRRARANRGLNKLDAAVSDLKEAIRLEPRGYYLQQLGDVYSVQKKYDLAFQTYKEGAQLEPTSALWYSKLSDIGLIIHRPLSEALSFSNKAIQLAPSDSLNYGQRCCIEAALKDNKSALSDIKRAIDLAPSEPLNHFRAACLLEYLGNFKAALFQIDRAISLRNTSYFFTCRSEIEMRLKNYKNAIDDANTALRLEPAQSKAMGLRSHLYAQTGEYEQALDDFEGAHSSEPASVSSRKNSVVSASELHDVASSYSRILHLFPDDTTALYNRGLSYLCLGDWKRGAEDLDKFVVLTSPSDARFYAACFANIAYREAKQQLAAGKVLLKISSQPAAKKVSFPNTLILYMLNQIDAPTVLKSALKADDLSRARCIIGLDLLLKKQQIAGTKYLHQVIASGDPKLDEYSLAQTRLRSQ